MAASNPISRSRAAVMVYREVICSAGAAIFTLNMTFSSNRSNTRALEKHSGCLTGRARDYTVRRVDRARTSSADISNVDRWTSPAMPLSSNPFPSRAIVTDASEITRPDIVVNVSSREACACVARPVAFDQRDRLVDEFAAAHQPVERVLQHAG